MWPASSAAVQNLRPVWPAGRGRCQLAGERVVGKGTCLLRRSRECVLPWLVLWMLLVLLYIDVHLFE